MTYKSTPVLLVLMLLVFFNSKAQNHSLDKQNSQLSILGTSSLHDWVSVVEKFSAQADISDTNISNVEFEVIVKSIKSGKSGMDNNTYDALKEKANPKIFFKAKSLSFDGSTITGNGDLTIAGKTKSIPISLNVVKKDLYIISGEIKLKMTDYGVTPPTAMFGTIKTGDEVTLEFTFSMKPNN